MPIEQRVRVRLNISAEQFTAYYSGQVKAVNTRASDGRRVQFPADVLRQFVMATGISGDFDIIFDEQNKFIRIERVS